MEIVPVILIIVIIALIISLKKNVQKRMDALESELRRLRELLSTFTQEKTQPAVTVIPPVTEEIPIIKPKDINVKAEEDNRSLSEELELLLRNPAQPVEQLTGQEAVVENVEAEPAMVYMAGDIPPQPTPGPARSSFLERNPDLEKFIGENLVSKIGIGILVLAIGFFVKYAIDNDWIGPLGRVGIGILCGGVLVGVAHALRKDYKAFSSVLVGGGLAIFYFTITLAFHQFHLFSQTIAFIIMVVITGFAVVLSQLYNRQELAIIALIGGFATPFMVSTGSGNFKILFTYLVILNAGLLVIAYNKAWRLLNFLAFTFTAILFGSWLFSLEWNAPLTSFRTGFLFATLFYILFLVINIAHNIRENKKFIASDFSILLSNTCLYFAAGLYLLTEMHAGIYRGLFTASLGAFNLAASFLLLKQKKIDNNILYLLIGITLSFISLTAPIQLNGHNITLFWATESVLLYWLFQKSGIRIIRISALLVWVAMLISLFMDWAHVYGRTSGNLPVIFNKGFITTVFAAMASYTQFLLRKNELNEKAATPLGLQVKEIFRITGLILLYVAGAFEINFQFVHAYENTNLHILYLLLYTSAFVLSFVVITEKIKSVQSRWYVRTGLMAICVAIYLVCIPEIFSIQRNLLANQQQATHFIAHWINALVMAVILYRLVALLRNNLSPVQRFNTQLTWVCCFAIILFLSAEVHLVVNTLFYTDYKSLVEIQRVFIKTGLPILWGLCSFGFMWLGMRLKYRTLRIVSLTLFSIILGKLFLFDIRNIPVAGKIAAFFCLGVLLLVVSFMYQRLRKIIIDDEKKPSI